MHHAMKNAPEQSRLLANYIQRPPIRRSLSKRKTKSRPHIRGQKTRGTTRKRKITTKTLATISARTTKNSKNKLRDSPPQIKLLSQNLQGDKSGYKMEHLTNVMRDRYIDFLCVQETHLAGTFEKKQTNIYSYITAPPPNRTEAQEESVLSCHPKPKNLGSVQANVQHQ